MSENILSFTAYTVSHSDFTNTAFMFRISDLRLSAVSGNQLRVILVLAWDVQDSWSTTPMFTPVGKSLYLQSVTHKRVSLRSEVGPSVELFGE